MARKYANEEISEIRGLVYGTRGMIVLWVVTIVTLKYIKSVTTVYYS